MGRLSNICERCWWGEDKLVDRHGGIKKTTLGEGNGFGRIYTLYPNSFLMWVVSKHSPERGGKVEKK
jgi:hypothetical protein